MRKNIDIIAFLFLALDFIHIRSSFFVFLLVIYKRLKIINYIWFFWRFN